MSSEMSAFRAAMTISDAPVIVYLIRHVTTRANEEEVYAGRTDGALARRARSQTDGLVSYFRDRRLNHVYSSPQRRALVAAKHLASQLQVPALITDDLAEMDMGPWQGLKGEDISERYPHDWQVWRRDPWQARVQGMETLREVEHRSAQWLDDVLQRSPCRVAAFTHEAVIKTLIGFVLGGNRRCYRSIIVPNASVSSLQWQANEWAVRSVNEYVC